MIAYGSGRFSIQSAISRKITAASSGTHFPSGSLSRSISIFRLGITLLLFLCCGRGVYAQFTGFSVPQPVSTIPFPAGTACTGAQQVALVPNLGQTEHFITIATSGVIAFRATVQGSHEGVTFNDISDVLTASGSTSMGQGYFPVVQVSVTCSSASGTFGVRYSAEATAPAMQIAAMQSAQLDKTLAVAAPSNANFTTQVIRTPFGTSGGGIYFAYSAAGPAGSILNVGCTTLSIGTTTSVASFPLSTATTPQFFTVPLLPCDFVTIAYTSGGASATTFTSSYVFNNQTITGGDPCQGATAVKSAVAINVSAAGTTQIVAPLTSHSVFVCGFNFTLSGTTSPTLQFITGTGATCGTGTITQTGAMLGNNSTTNSSATIDSGGGGYTVFKGSVGQGLCPVAGGTAPSAQGLLTFIQQ